MTIDQDNLERLFSRELDGEATAEDRVLLEDLLRSDPRVQQRFDEYCAMDRAIGAALRTAAGQPRPVLRLQPTWRRAGRGLIVAAAACLAAIVWYRPATSVPPTANEPRQAGPTGSPARWVVPTAAMPRTDVGQPVPRVYEHPELKLRGTQREWILVPGDEPGTFFVIEVDRIRTHSIPVHKDY